MVSNLTALFSLALGLQHPWVVTEVRFDPDEARIHADISTVRGARFPCPVCGAPEQPVHDTQQRTWRHLNFFQYETYIHARLPRVRCAVCGRTTQVQAPWARPRSGFTLLMEALVLSLCQQMPVRRVAERVGVSDKTIWNLIEHYEGMTMGAGPGKRSRPERDRSSGDGRRRPTGLGRGRSGHGGHRA